MTVAQPVHSALGASTCERWWNCPGSVELIEKAPAPLPSKYAAEGTVAHSLAAQRLDEYLGRKPTTALKLGDKVEQDTFKITVSQDMFDAVDVYIEYIVDIIERYKLNKDTVLVEQRIQIPGSSRLYGTADCVIPVPFEKVIAIDYKHGAGTKVRAEDNKQLQYYAVGALMAMPEDVRHDMPTVQLVIVQPRAPGGGIETSLIDTKALYEFHMELLNKAGDVKPGAPVAAGSWCKFCPAKPICPALQTYVAEEAGLDFQEIKALPAISKPMLPTPSQLTPDVVANILKHTDLIKAWLDSVYDYGYTLAQAGVEVPGFKLVAKRANRQWIDETKAAEALAGISHLIYSEPSLLSPAKAEKVIQKWDKNSDCKYGPVLESLIEKPDNGKTLAKVNDQRPGEAPSAVSDFNNV